VSTFAARDGAVLHYDDPNPDAPGAPVLALAGLTRAASDFDFLRPHVPGIRLIAMDYRGRGRSARTGAITYTVPQEAEDALALLDHLGLPRAGILGTSRGGLIAMLLARAAPARLAGVLLNDIGPVIASRGIETIRGYLGRPPAARTIPDAAASRAEAMAAAGFEGVPMSRWIEEAQRHLHPEGDGLALDYDPDLRLAFLMHAQPQGDLWDAFEALPSPLAALRGANSELLDRAVFAEMRRRRPDMLAAEVPGRGHVPFLDEPESVRLIRDWAGRL
jgi:pimeloyl-ACP methyl ester carboxylesterase